MCYVGGGGTHGGGGGGGDGGRRGRRHTAAKLVQEWQEHQGLWSRHAQALASRVLTAHLALQTPY